MSQELEASLVLIFAEAVGWPGGAGPQPRPTQAWVQPSYEDDGRQFWRVLPGQGFWSGALLAPIEVEIIRQGRVVIDCREMVRG